MTGLEPWTSGMEASLDGPTIPLRYHYGKNRLCQAAKTLGEGRKTLGKAFAEFIPSGLSAKGVGRGGTGKDLFAEFIPSGLSAKPLPCVIIKRSAKKSKRTLPTRKQ